MRTLAPTATDINRPSFRLVALLAVSLVVLRSVVWIVWEQSYFDSDQAIVGLMTKHLAEFRTFPVVFYGQTYALAVEAWLAAPLFALFGSSVAMLKLPVLAVNVVVATLLIGTLVRDAGLRPWTAGLSALFFALPPPIASSRLLEASDVNAETFLYTLLLWRVRDRPVLFGVIGGIGFLNREFTIYGVAAIVLLECWHGLSRGAINWRSRAISLAIIVAIVLTMSWLTPHAALLGPGTAGAPATAQLVRNATNGSASRITWNASAIGSNVRWLFTSNLPAIFGWQPAPLERYVTSTISSGHVWALVALVALAGLASTTWIRWRIGRVSVTPGDPADARQAGARNGRRSAPDPLIPGPSFVIYLILVGLMAILAYVTVSRYVQDHMLIRYTLLALLTPIGITAWLFRVEQARWIQGAAAASILAWSLAAGTDDARLLAEYVRNPPPDEYRQLNVFLWDQGVRYGKAPYWTAYMIDFLSNERIVLNSSDVVRVLEYRNIVNQHLDDAFTVSNGPCVSPEAIAFQRWCLAPMAK